MAALEAKLECYEKEVKQFQKALEKSDKYILDLEQKIRDKSASKNTSLILKENAQYNTFNSQHFAITNENASVSKSSLNFAKLTESSNKNVKFSDPISSISPISSNSNILSPSQPGMPMNKQVVITKDNFYGSPSKSNSNASGNNSRPIISFADRLKKNSVNQEATQIIQKPVAETTVPLPPVQSSSNNLNPQSFLFSPMKRLRLDEFVFEKPSFTAEDTMNNTTLNTNMPDLNQTPQSPPNHVTNETLNDESPIRLMDMDSKKLIIKQPNVMIGHDQVNIAFKKK